MQNAVSIEKSNFAALEKKDRDLHCKIEMMSVAECDLNAVLGLLEDCCTEFKKMDAARQQVASEERNIEKKRAEIKEAQVKEQVHLLVNS